MDQRINRFKLCDLRFHPYLRRVLGRLPEEIREIVLNDMTFQILTDEEFNLFNRKGEKDPILEDILPSKNLGFLDSDIGRTPDSLSNRKTMLAGILTAVKEANL